MQTLFPPVVPPIEVKQWTLDEYHRMIEDGYFDEDNKFELLEGWIVAKMSRGPTHDDAIESAQYVLMNLLPRIWRVRVQLGFTIEISRSEPEPDLIVCTPPNQRKDRHPEPLDTPLVIEVSDSSLTRDRTIKQRIYARAVIPIYWIINIPDRQVEVYTDPSGPTKTPKYRRKRYYRSGSTVPVVIAGEELGRIAVSSMFRAE